jgi:hypothetical protein
MTVQRVPQTPRDKAESVAVVGDEIESLVDYCARPQCRAEFRAGGRGRRKAYCSEICRRTAEREHRAAAARLAHFESLVERLRIDLSAFGRPDTADSASDQDPDGQRQIAQQALARAGGVLAFLQDSSEPLAQELKALHEAVAPLVE